MIDTLANECLQRGIRLSTAESCTGGMVSAAFTDLAGSSSWFDAGFITYSNDAKMKMLNVSEGTLSAHGAVSEAVVSEMAIGAVKNSLAHYAVSISGIAGPGGGTQEKPVGMVCFGVSDGKRTQCETQYFKGDRASVRLQSRDFAISFLLETILRWTL